MTTEDQDAEVGRLVRERRDLRAEHQALVSKAEKLGKLLSSVGKALSGQKAPGGYAELTLKIEPDGSVRVSDEYQYHQVISGKFPSLDEVRQLRTEMEATKKRLTDLDAQLKAFGV